MRSINLCAGKGNGIDTACLMMAASMLNGDAKPSDNSSCVCSVARRFIIPTNDPMPDDVRAEFYGPLAFEIIGTRSPKHERERGFVAADYAVRVFAPIALESSGLYAEARKLRNLPKIVDAASAAAAAARAAVSAAVSASVDHVADSYFAGSYFANSYAAAAARIVDARSSAGAAAAGISARSAAGAAAEDGWRTIAPICVQCIRDMIAIGSRTPIEPAYTFDELAEALG